MFEKESRTFCFASVGCCIFLRLINQSHDTSFIAIVHMTVS